MKRRVLNKSVTPLDKDLSRGYSKKLDDLMKNQEIKQIVYSNKSYKIDPQEVSILVCHLQNFNLKNDISVDYHLIRNPSQISEERI